MAALKNNRYETFAQGLFSGMSQRAAYRAAFPASVKWKDKTVDVKACELAGKPEITERIDELKAASASDAILSRKERMLILSNIALDIEQHPKQRMQAIDILNKMDGDYVKKIETTIKGDVSKIAAQVGAILNE